MLEHVVIWGYIDILVVAEKEFVSEWEDEDSTSGYQPYEAEITAPRPNPNTTIFYPAW